MKIIAEAGHNHLGNPSILDGMIQAAIKSKVDGMTFQLREDEFYEANPDLEIHWIEVETFITALKDNDIEFGLCPGEVEHIEEYDEKVDFYKILAKDFENEELVQKAIDTGKPVYISTGDVDLDDLKLWTQENVQYIHTQFSNECADANISAIKTIRDATRQKVGFGLHSSLKAITFCAISYKPDSIFFYIGDTERTSIPDLAHTIDRMDAPYYVWTLRELQKCLGNGIKAKQERKIFNGTND